MGIKQSFINTMFIVIFFYCLGSVALSQDTLKQGDTLNSTAYLVSAKKLFTLGFFTPSLDSSDTYLGIWYNNVSNPPVPVWVGNRNTPISKNSGVLTIDGAGKLVITHKGKDPIELYAGLSTSNTTAILLDSGNFILMEVNSSDRVLWQSFDYPTDTLLPGMKLGVDHRNGRNWSLTSWFSQTVPESGPFTLDWDPSEGQLVVRRRGVIYWKSGIMKDMVSELRPQKKVLEFQFMPQPNISNFNYNFSNVTNENEEYFSYSLIVDNYWTPEDRRIISGWNITYMGQILDNQGRPDLARVDLCYGYNTKGIGSNFYAGCEFWKQPKCRNPHEMFDLRSGGFGLVDQTIDGNSSLSLSDCRDNCWNDCDCVGFNSYGDGCMYWRGKELKFQQDYSGATVTQYVLISEPSSKKWKKWIWIVIAVVVSLFMLLSGLLCYLRRKRKQGKEQELLELMTLDGYTDSIVLENDGKKGHNIRIFSFACMADATNSFSSENKLGQGGFGPVYKGKLSEGQQIAVKRLSRTSGQGLLEFKNELILIAELQHMNLVRLLGFCIHGHEKMLIYEYMPNKSLDFFLFDKTKSVQLTWERRFNIIEGSAQGLLYLHKYSRLRIVHRDLKASNILLDENMNPKISDFGMARIFKQNLSEANTNRVVGTYGYMAPEYAMEGIFSDKSDVFSFGVLMLEIVSGQKNNSFYRVEGPLNLVEYAWELWNRGAALELMDPTLSGLCIVHQVLRCIHVGLLCVEYRAADRPTMSDVISMLTNDNVDLPMPKKVAFFRGGSVVDEDLQRNKTEKLSVNGLTISTMVGR